MTVLAAIDLGKSACRLLIVDGERRARFDGAGAPGLGVAGGTEAAERTIARLLSDAGSPTISQLGVGAAGALAAPRAAADLAVRLRDRTMARIAVASDVMTAHAGAFAGRIGTLLVAGTGAAALGVDKHGVRLVDGWGPDLGDFGSGAWLGREGIRATLRANDGLGPETILADALRTHIAPQADVQSWLSSPESVARQLASFAPNVLDASEQGDEVAIKIVSEAVRLLTTTATAASEQAKELVLHGGLTHHAGFRSTLERSLLRAGRTIVPAEEDALDGAQLLVQSEDLPHERYLHRAG